MTTSNQSVTSRSSTDGWTALTEAAEHGEEEKVTMLLKCNASVNDKNAQGKTALSLATENGHTEIVRLLLNNRANVNAQDLNKMTPLIKASEKGHVEIVQLLLQFGANVYEKLPSGYTAIMRVSKSRNTSNAQKLLESKANFGQSALIMATINRHKDIVKLLLRYMDDVNEQYPHRLTSLMIAAKNGDKDIVNLILDHQADVNQKYYSGKTALMIAAERGYTDLITSLLEHKADIDAQDHQGNTAIMIAVSSENYDMAEFLLDNGATINSTSLLALKKKSLVKYSFVSEYQENDDSPRPDVLRKPLKTSKFKKQENLEPYFDNDLILGLIKNRCTGLMKSIMFGNIDTVKLLLDKKASVTMTNLNAERTLCLTCINGDTEMIRLLLDYKSNVDQTMNSDLTTALMVTSKIGKSETIQFPLRYKAEINERNHDFETVFSLACKNGQIVIVKLLLDNEANVNQHIDSNGNTTLMKALTNENQKMAQLLLSYKADIDAKNYEFETAFMLAVQTRNIKTVQLLLYFKADINIKI
ncbi:serine/threonine-protein phosphatase 6 regulatory ankyrin repeat subunit B [Biomphalaria glabrata]|nr:serine/threonine-protein phosphatase 6 regulatory ankyrin repeat subunit B-like [Biomphalaria glabrata]